MWRHTGKHSVLCSASRLRSRPIVLHLCSFYVWSRSFRRVCSFLRQKWYNVVSLGIVEAFRHLTWVFTNFPAKIPIWNAAWLGSGQWSLLAKTGKVLRTHRACARDILQKTIFCRRMHKLLRIWSVWVSKWNGKLSLDVTLCPLCFQSPIFASL